MVVSKQPLFEELKELFKELTKQSGSQEAAILSLLRYFKFDIDALVPDNLLVSNAEYERIASRFDKNPD
jgi:hypothetical protein